MLTRRNGEKYITTHPVIRQWILSSNRKLKLSQIAPKMYERKKPSLLLGVEVEFEGLTRSLQHFVLIPAKTAAPDWAPLPKSCTDCGFKGSTARCNASDKTAAGRDRAEPYLPAYNETLCEMTTVHNYILYRLKQCLIRLARDNEHKHIFMHAQ